MIREICNFYHSLTTRREIVSYRYLKKHESISLTSSGDSCLLEFGNKTLNFIVLDFKELFHFLYLEFQYFNCTLKLLYGIILLNHDLFDLLILRYFFELRLLSFGL